MYSLTRRLFIGTGMAAIAVTGGSVFACRQQDRAALDFRRLDVLLANVENPVEIGRSFRKVNGFDTLANEARSRAHIVQALHMECPSSRYEILSEGIRKEFALRDTIICNRFVLSRTECIIAGLLCEHIQANGFS